MQFLCQVLRDLQAEPESGSDAKKFISRETGTLVHWWWKCETAWPLHKTDWQFMKKIKIELQYDPAIPPEYLSQEYWNQDLKVVSHSHVHCSIIHNSQDAETTKGPWIGEWITNRWYLHTME